jgi:cardiolipin synthase
MSLSIASRSSLTIPNLITLSRILLTPLFIICIIQGQYRRALAVFFLAGVSDLADGLIARHWQQKSPLGAYLDPLADKLLMSASFVTLSIAHHIPSWLTVVVLSRDITLALGVALFRLADLALYLRPSWAGKCTTFLQLSTVLLVLLGKLWTLPPAILQGFFWLTGGMTVVSGVHYVLRALMMAGQSSNHHREKGDRG